MKENHQGCYVANSSKLGGKKNGSFGQHMENAQREGANFSGSSTATLAKGAQKRRKSKLVNG